MFIVYIMAVYFLFILIFGGRANRIHSAIIFLASILNIVFQLPESYDLKSYVYNRNVFVLWDGVTAVILTMFLVFDKTAWKQAVLLAFAVLCHSMIIYDLTISSSPLTNFFYSFYDELIIIVGLLQMMVSYDGIISALYNLQKLLFRINVYINSISKSFSTSKKRENQT